MQEATKEWVQYAEADFESVQYLLEKSSPSQYGNICYHAQQCIEKYLKALLVENNLPVDRTHRLARLIDLLTPYYPELSLHREEFIILTDYATDARYPGEMQITRKRALDALELASDFRKLLRNILNLG